MTRPPRLVALGDLLLDIVVKPEKPIERGTDVPGRLAFKRGGSAATTAAAFARAGGSASLVTTIGEDAWAARLSRSLRAEGVRVHAVRKRGRTGRLAALIDDRGERSFVTERGVADALAPRDLEDSWFRAASVLHVPAYSLFAEPIGAASLEAARLARAAGAGVSCDLSSEGPLRAYGVRRARQRVDALAPDILFANRAEAAAFLGRHGRRVWPRLLAHAPVAVVKDGAWGCRVLWLDTGDGAVNQLDVAATPATFADTTGAGDAFAAGFLYSLTRTGRTLAGTDPRSARTAALAGHRSAAATLKRGRPDLVLG